MAQRPDLEVPASWLPTLRLGEHLALDFINTVVQSGSAVTDCLTSDLEVLKWLHGVGALPTTIETALELTAKDPGRLQASAIELRAASRMSIDRRKQGQCADPHVLNQVLARGLGYYAMRWDADTAPQIIRHYPAEIAVDLLLPIAEAVADLLVNADFNLVRKCENTSCRLWFYDRTKSHRRRWCSTALCGNRMKVAAFRKRQRGL